MTIQSHSGATHHLLKLFKIHIPIIISINVSDHSPAITKRAFLPQPPHHRVKLFRRDQPILIQIIHLKRLSKLLRITTAVVQLPEFLQINVTVAVPIKLLHHTSHFLRRCFRSERRHHLLQLRAWDLPVAVLVEFVEDLANFFLVHGLRNRNRRVSDFLVLWCVIYRNVIWSRKRVF